MKNRLYIHSIKRQIGVGLIELMISMVISLLLVSAVVGLTISSSTTYRMQTNHARNQENGRFAISFLSRDLRMAGYLGCLDSDTLLTNNLDVAKDGNLYDQRFGLEGLEQGTSSFQPSGNSASGLNIKPGTDAITVRFANPTLATNLDANAAPTGTIDAGNNNANFSFNTGNIVIISDCDKGDIFQVTGVADGNVISHATGGSAPGNLTEFLGGISTTAYDISESVIMQLDSVRYFVRHRDTSDTTSPVALYRSFISGTGTIRTQEVVEGVENLQFLYGEDTSGDGIANTFVKAGSVTNWGAVVSVKVGILVRSSVEAGTKMEQTQALGNNATKFDILDETTTATTDRYQRDLYTATIQLRNRL
ncbi:MAG: pilus assembly protein PilW [marine bacterium B5-7]|nr:MAG: pilus assembly protein PilW [marine bacterium B5-7]